jgi:hypothetical protein
MITNIDSFIPWIVLLTFISFPVSYIYFCWGWNNSSDFLENLPISFTVSVIVFSGGFLVVSGIAIIYNIVNAVWTYTMTLFN